MKRIINGVTYNTDTSTVLAKSGYGDEESEGIETLYRSRGGAFFLVKKGAKIFWSERGREWETKDDVTFQPLSPEKAHSWMLTGQVEVIENPFDEPPEATAEAEPASTIYVRVPAALKRRIDEAARQAEMSVNAWVMRCLKQCLPASDHERAMLELARELSELNAVRQEIEMRLTHVSERIVRSANPDKEEQAHERVMLDHLEAEQQVIEERRREIEKRIRQLERIAKSAKPDRAEN